MPRSIAFVVYFGKAHFAYAANPPCLARFKAQSVKLAAHQDNKPRHVYPRCENNYSGERTVYQVVSGKVVYIKRKSP